MTTQEPRDADTVVERQEYVEREPVQPAGTQVNVNADRGGYARDTVVVDPGPGPMAYVRRIVVLLFGILTVMIALRIILLLLGANAGNGLVDFVYGATEPFVAPFRGIFSFDQVTPIGTNVLDIGAAVALVGWLLIEALVLAILRIAEPARRV
jgi:uncharacterized protein YggT (Ycf19 family)